MYDKLVVVNDLMDKERVLKDLGLADHPDVGVVSINSAYIPEGIRFRELIWAPNLLIKNDRHLDIVNNLEYISRKRLVPRKGNRPTVAPRKETTELNRILSDISLSVSDLVEKVLDRNETYYEARRELRDLRFEYREGYEKAIIGKATEVVTRRALNQKIN